MTTPVRSMRTSPGIVLAGAMLAGGCASVAPLSDAERAALSTPSSALAERVGNSLSTK